MNRNCRLSRNWLLSKDWHLRWWYLSRNWHKRSPWHKSTPSNDFTWRWWAEFKAFNWILIWAENLACNAFFSRGSINFTEVNEGRIIMN